MRRMKKIIIGQILAYVLIFSIACPGNAKNARNIILMIGDGLGPAQVHAIWLYSTMYLGRNLTMTEIMDKGRTAYVHNEAQNDTVTDSAAAATQMSTGKRVPTRIISVGTDGKTLKTILEIAREKGKSTGLVTNSAITDATPAAFAAHVRNRRDEHTVAGQLINSDVNVLFGGGRSFFIPEAMPGGKRKDGRNILDEARKNNYLLVETSEAMKKTKGNKILGVFSNGDMAYESDRSGSKEPSLADMTEKAIELLSDNPKGFFLMVEAGGLDRAAHYNDIKALVSEGIAFDEAINVAYEFQKRNNDTLLIITGDHETGGLTMLSLSPSTVIKGKDGAKGEVSGIRKATRWATKSHTASPLFLWGIGPGSEKINGWKHSTDVFRIMVDAYGN